MNRILLIDPDTVKEYSNIDANTAGDYMTVAIREAQEMDLEATIGSKLYDSLLEKVANHSISGQYKTLLEDKIHPFLIYATVARLIPSVSYKITNAGVVSTTDVNLINTQNDVLNRIRQEAINNRDIYKKRLQDYLKKNDFPELHSCQEVHKNLYSSSSCPIWLGGYYGKKC